MPNYALWFLTRSFFKDFNFFKVLLPWQPELFKESNYFNNFKEDHVRNISVKFHQNPMSSFREDVLKTTLMDGRTTDNGP